MLACLTPPPPPHPKSPPPCDAMDPGRARQEGPPAPPPAAAAPSAASADPEQQDPAEFWLQVDFFRKLGYSQREVRAALRKLGLSADTNAVLGELIRYQGDAEREPAAAPLTPPPAPAPVLVPRTGGSARAPGGLPPAPPTPPQDEDAGGGEDAALKPIVIDGSNVAMSHGNKEVFSCQGIQLAVNYFLDRGHTDITVFVPSWRKEQPRPDVPITDQHILRELERKKIVVFTPSRRVGGKRVVCYDDRFIVKLAYESGGVIVSNDTYRDLQSERQEWRRCVEERLLMYSFVNDKFMPPDDPLGRHGPSLENFLRKKPLVPEHKRPPCPYGRKCTYGIKCKFYHQDRAHQSQRSLADELRANAKLSAHQREDRRAPPSPQRAGHQGDAALGAGLSLEQEVEFRLSLEQRGPVSENVLLHRGGGAGTGGGAQHGRRSAPKKGPPANHHHHHHHHNAAPADSAYLSSSSQERLDSGLGSYESHRDPHASPCPSSCPSSSSSSSSSCPSCRSPPQGCVGSGWGAPDRQNGRPACGCCSSSSRQAPPACPHHYGQGSAPCQPWSPAAAAGAFGGGPLYSSAPPPYSFPQVPQKYWSDSSYQPGPPPRAANSLPEHLRSPAPSPEHGLMGVYGGGEQHHWGPTPGPPRDPYQAEREEVRMKLRAIFHPGQVDRVMGMFPHVLDPQALAAKILTLKSQGGAL